MPTATPRRKGSITGIQEEDFGIGSGYEGKGNYILHSKMGENKGRTTATKRNSREVPFPPTLKEQLRIAREAIHPGGHLRALLEGFVPVEEGIQLGIVADIDGPTLFSTPIYDIKNVEYPNLQWKNIRVIQKQILKAPRIISEDYDGLVTTNSLPVKNIRLHPDIVKSVHPSYEKDTPIKDIPIYFVVLTTEGHASLVILVNGSYFSLGLGLIGINSSLHQSEIAKKIRMDSINLNFIGKAALYSPDYLVKPLGKNKFTGLPTNFTIIDVGFFKTKHMNRIRKIVEKNEGMATVGLRHKKLKDGTIHYTLDNIVIEMEFLYSYLSSRPVTNITGNLMNCTSFLESVFSERIRCNVKTKGGLAIPITDPNQCVSKVDFSPYQVIDPSGHIQREGVDVFATHILSAYQLHRTIPTYDEGTFELLNQDHPGKLSILYDCTLGLCAPRGSRLAEVLGVYGGGVTRRTRRARRATRRKSGHVKNE